MVVTIIRRDSAASLIEWRDKSGLHRGTIPSSVLKGDTVQDELLSLAIPYGVDWEFILEGALVQVTPAMLADRLRNAGIWTAQDARNHSAEVLSAIQACYGVDLSTILRALKSV